MWAEDDDPFFGGFGPFGAGAIVGIGFSSRPAGDGMLQAVEYLDVDFVGCGVFQGKVAQPMLVVIFAGEFEDGLTYFLRQPDDGFTNQVIVPIANANQPGRFVFGQILCCTGIYMETGIRVFLQKGRRNRRRNFIFHRLFYHFCFVLSPGQQVNGFGSEDGANAHGHGAVGDVFLAWEIFKGIPTGQGIETNHPGIGRIPGTWFVESNVSGTANA